MKGIIQHHYPNIRCTKAQIPLPFQNLNMPEGSFSDLPVVDLPLLTPAQVEFLKTKSGNVAKYEVDAALAQKFNDTFMTVFPENWLSWLFEVTLAAPESAAKGTPAVLTPEQAEWTLEATGSQSDLPGRRATAYFNKRWGTSYKPSELYRVSMNTTSYNALRHYSEKRKARLTNDQEALNRLLWLESQHSDAREHAYWEDGKIRFGKWEDKVHADGVTRLEDPYRAPKFDEVNDDPNHVKDSDVDEGPDEGVFNYPVYGDGWEDFVSSGPRGAPNPSWWQDLVKSRS